MTVNVGNDGSASFSGSEAQGSFDANGNGSVTASGSSWQMKDGNMQMNTADGTNVERSADGTMKIQTADGKTMEVKTPATGMAVPGMSMGSDGSTDMGDATSEQE